MLRHCILLFVWRSVFVACQCATRLNNDSCVHAVWCGLILRWRCHRSCVSWRPVPLTTAVQVRMFTCLVVLSFPSQLLLNWSGLSGISALLSQVHDSFPPYFDHCFASTKESASGVPAESLRVGMEDEGMAFSETWDSRKARIAKVMKRWIVLAWLTAELS
jgi:hypothetical protein